MKRSLLTVLFLPLLAVAETLHISPRPSAAHLTVAPGTTKVVLDFSGHESLTVDDSGHLVITDARATMVQKLPFVTQRAGESLRLVSSEYVLGKNGDVELHIGPHDLTRPVDIDWKTSTTPQAN